MSSTLLHGFQSLCSGCFFGISFDIKAPSQHKERECRQESILMLESWVFEACSVLFLFQLLADASIYAEKNCPGEFCIGSSGPWNGRWDRLHGGQGRCCMLRWLRCHLSRFNQVIGISAAFCIFLLPEGRGKEWILRGCWLSQPQRFRFTWCCDHLPRSSVYLCQSEEK